MTDLADLISVLVVTSPTASDPSTDAITETIESVWDSGLESNHITIGADGVRPEQRGLAIAYGNKLDDIESNTDAFTSLRRLPRWGHQANCLRLLLAEVQTPLILFLEHDCPLLDCPIDWQTAAECLMAGQLDLLRFHHESHILPEHAHLMLDTEPQYYGTLPYLRTAQWSQRPHLARTDWYRNLIDTYFAPSSRSMCEDVLHGVVQHHWRTYGLPGWERFKLGIFADPTPETFQRSYHLDGRAGGDKYEMCFSYPGDTWPEGAPAPTLGRVFED